MDPAEGEKRQAVDSQAALSVGAWRIDDMLVEVVGPSTTREALRSLYVP
jgi:hypothetical protein